MGTAAAARIAIHFAVVCAVAGWTATARAESRCTGSTASGSRFAACFDRGNRLFLTASTDGYGGGIALRHVIRFDDEPDLIWKLEHRILHALGSHFSRRLHAVLYSGRYLRHARDGHVVLPFSVGRKIFLPFDIGADATVGSVEAAFDASGFALGVFDGTALLDWSRSAGFRRRVCVGSLLRWQVEVEREPLSVAEHAVVPFTAAVLDAHAESQSGITAAGLRFEVGRAWSGARGWHTLATARLSFERILLAVNDRPLSVVLGASYLGAEEDLRGQIGLRMALFQRAHERVVLDPLQVSESQ